MADTATIPIPPDAGRSWWLTEALARPEFAGEPSPALTEDTTADVVILGGGYTGMWTAFHLKQLDPGTDVVILEQDICGGGPSGRNGGFVNSYWGDLPRLVSEFGDKAAISLCEAGEESVQAIGAFCAEHDVDAWFANDGDLNAAASDAQVGSWGDSSSPPTAWAWPRTSRSWGRRRCGRMVDSPTFKGGVFTKYGASVQPARLARGLRRVLMDQGVRIYEQTPVTRFGIGVARDRRDPRRHGARGRRA